MRNQCIIQITDNKTNEVTTTSSFKVKLNDKEFTFCLVDGTVKQFTVTNMETFDHILTSTSSNFKSNELYETCLRKDDISLKTWLQERGVL